MRVGTRCGSGIWGWGYLVSGKVDTTGQVHVTYGALHEVYDQRYDAAGQAQLGGDVRVFDGLGDWPLATGLSAVAGGDDGSTVVAVAIRSDGTASIDHGALVWAFSRDGGQSWSAPADLGWCTSGGAGRPWGGLLGLRLAWRRRRGR